MDYDYIDKAVKDSGMTLPCTAVNENNEDVIIEGNESCYITTTLQKNDWCRVNEFYPDGTTTETYER